MEWINPSQNPEYDNKDFFSDCPICGYTVSYGEEPEVCPNCKTTIIEPRCDKCKFCRKLKHNFKVGEGFEETLCCIMLLAIDEAEKGKFENESQPWVQQVESDSYCEMFTKKRNTDNE